MMMSVNINMKYNINQLIVHASINPSIHLSSGQVASIQQKFSPPLEGEWSRYEVRKGSGWHD